MHGTRFDRLAQRLSQAGAGRTGRRGLLAAAVALVTGASVAHDAGAAKRRRPRRRTTSTEACIPTGNQCPSPKPRGRKRGGRKGKRAKQLSCQQCCQRHVATNANGKRVCACQPETQPCRETRECCSGLCTGGTCQSGATPSPPPDPCAACTATQLCEGGVCQACDVCQPAGSCPYDTVQAAVEDSNGPSTVRVCPGTYDEDADASFAVRIARNLRLIGAGDGTDAASNTILRPTRAGQATVGVFGPGTSQEVTLERLRITGDTITETNGVTVFRSTATIAGCTVTGYTLTPAVGAGLRAIAANVTLTATVITENSAANGGGIYVAPSSRVNLDSLSRVTHNEATFAAGGGGIFNEGTVELPSVANVTDNDPDDCRGPGTYTGPGNVCTTT